MRCLGVKFLFNRILILIVPLFLCFYTNQAQTNDNDPEVMVRLGNKLLSTDINEGIDSLHNTAMNFPDEVGAETYFKLSNILRNGPISHRDYLKSFEYTNKSAELGHPSSQLRIGSAYSTGIISSIPKDEGLSLLYYTFSARNDNYIAKMGLGFRLKVGKGVRQSCEAAVEHYQQAALASLEEESWHDDRRYSIRRLEVELERTSNAYAVRSPNDMSEELMQYIQSQADSGDISSQLVIANTYFDGYKKFPKDYSIALKYYKLSTENDEVGEGYSKLAMMYDKGLGVLKNTATAIELFNKAAALGDDDGFLGLGEYHLNGIQVKKNETLAKTYFVTAANAGNSIAMFKLGLMYMKGIGMPKPDFNQAANYLTQAGNHGNKRAFYELARMNELGRGKKKSCKNALALYKAIAESSNTLIEIVEEAYEAYMNNDHSAALLMYSELADIGIEAAASNAAFLLDRRISLSINDSQEHIESLAASFYQTSFDLGSSRACLKLGDYHFYGRGGLRENFKKAVELYTVASNSKIGQASWNLGYMYEYGIGVEKDLYLAKRYYDMCRAVDPKGTLASYVSIGKWWLHYWLDTYTSDTEEDLAKSNVNLKSSTKEKIVSADSNDMYSKQSYDGNGSYIDFIYTCYEYAKIVCEEVIISISIEDLLIYCSTGLLIIIVHVVMRRRRR